jgi:hypothetical protein
LLGLQGAYQRHVCRREKSHLAEGTGGCAESTHDAS